MVVINSFNFGQNLITFLHVIFFYFWQWNIKNHCHKLSKWSHFFVWRRSDLKEQLLFNRWCERKKKFYSFLIFPKKSIWFIAFTWRFNNPIFCCGAAEKRQQIHQAAKINVKIQKIASECDTIVVKLFICIYYIPIFKCSRKRVYQKSHKPNKIQDI